MLKKFDRYPWKDWIVIMNEFLCEKYVSISREYVVDDLVSDDLVGRVIRLIENDGDY